MSESNMLEEHYRHPRNLGEIEDADAVALVHNPACGDMLRLAIKVQGGRIELARFKAYGCAAAIAASSVVTELITGTSLADAASLTDEDIVAVLGPLPPLKVHAIVLAREGVRHVLDRYQETRGETGNRFY